MIKAIAGNLFLSAIIIGWVHNISLKDVIHNYTGILLLVTLYTIMSRLIDYKFNKEE